MSSMTTLAAKYRLPLKTTPEDLEMHYGGTLDFEKPDGLKRILLAGYIYNPDGKSWIGAVYEYLDDDATTVEDEIAIREISSERFTTDGNAIAWAIANA